LTKKDNVDSGYYDSSFYTNSLDLGGFGEVYPTPQD